MNDRNPFTAHTHPESLILVVDGDRPKLFADPTGGLLSEVQALLPETRVTATHPDGIDAALAAASFAGARRAVIVDLWGGAADPRPPHTVASALGLEVARCESPPEAHAVQWAYVLGSIEPPQCELAPCA